MNENLRYDLRDSKILRVSRGSVRQHDVTHGTPGDSEFPRVSMSFLGRLSGTRADSWELMRLKGSMSIVGRLKEYQRDSGQSRETHILIESGGV